MTNHPGSAWSQCSMCDEEYRFAHKCVGVIRRLPQYRLDEIEVFQPQVDLIREQMADDISDDSYRPVSFGALRLMLYQIGANQ